MSPVAKALNDRERCARMIAEAIEAERARILGLIVLGYGLDKLSFQASDWLCDAITTGKEAR